jgi:aminoglycoside phosphotransferase (APT) family kinase protein
MIVEQFEGGQSNPDVPASTAGGRRYVLRKQPPGELLPSAHQVDREFRVMKALAPTGVPVPKMLALCDDTRDHRHPLLRDGVGRGSRLRRDPAARA